MHLRQLARLVPCLLLAACGSGGGSAPATGAPRTGIFIDSAVSGLDYETPTHAGRTTASGEFTYLDGEQVIFRIGSLVLGQARGADHLTPLELAGTRDPDDPRVLTRLQLLLTLDEDDDPNNGIQIAPATAARFRNVQTLPGADKLQALLDQAGIGRSVVTSDYAGAHFRLSLASLKSDPPVARFTTPADLSGTQDEEASACLLDRQTGLTWERKAESGLRSRHHSYHASASRNPEQRAVCEPGQEDCLAVTYTEAVNARKLCGHDDWRLPTERELKTLLDWSQRDPVKNLPAIDRHAFPDAEAGFYWTATSRRAQGAVAVAFDDTHRTLPSVSLGTGQAARIRLVRGTPIPDDPNPEDLPVSQPAFIPVADDGTLATAERASCIDDNQHPDSLTRVILWHPHRGQLARDAVMVGIAADNAAARCQQRDWRLPGVKDATRWLQLQLEQQDAFVQAFSGTGPVRALWAVDKNGRPVIVDPSGRIADTGTASLLALSARAARPPMPAQDGTPPDAATLADWRDRYSRYDRSAARQAAWPAPELDASVRADFRDLGLLPPMPFPADNPYSEAKTRLGEKLFNDPRLSRNNRIACASCHDPKTGWTDSKEVSRGHIGQLGGRNAMSIINSGYLASLFWDGRAASLEAQATGPVANPLEMHQPLSMAVGKIAASPDYGPLFAAAFGDPQVDERRIAMAIATFERTIISTESDFDRFLKGDRAALSDSALWGLHLFRTSARCINCHNGPLLSDQGFHNTGLHFIGRDKEDRGRGLITGRAADMGAFRTQGLRDLLYTGDYMHTGDMPLFEDGGGVLPFYNSGGNLVAASGTDKYTQPKPSPLLRPLGLSEAEMSALHDFLKSLSGKPRSRPASPEELGIR